MSKVIDAHMHVIPAFAGKRNECLIHAAGYGKLYYSMRGAWRPGAKRGLKRFMPPSFDDSVSSPEILMEYMDWAHIDAAVLQQSAMYGDFNEYLSNLVDKYPDKFVAFAFVDPRDGPKALEKLEWVSTDLNLVGIKLEPPDTPFWLDADEYLPYWEKVAKLNLLAAVDLGWDPPVNPYNFQLKQMENVIKRFPEMTAIILHLGVSYLCDQAQQYPFPILQQTLTLGKYPNVWFELAGLQEFCEGQEYPFPRAQEIVKAAVEQVGAQRIVWGTDYPGILCEGTTYHQCLNLIKNHCSFLSDADKALILGDTASKLYRFRFQ